MIAHRFYVDRKIDPETGEGGDHSRIIDVDGELTDADARVIVAAELDEDEAIGSVASIAIDDPDGHPVLST